MFERSEFINFSRFNCFLWAWAAVLFLRWQDTYQVTFISVFRLWTNRMMRQASEFTLWLHQIFYSLINNKFKTSENNIGGFILYINNLFIKNTCWFFQQVFGWDGRIRTSEMPGPKPGALPLGDVPMTVNIILYKYFLSRIL